MKKYFLSASAIAVVAALSYTYVFKSSAPLPSQTQATPAVKAGGHEEEGMLKITEERIKQAKIVTAEVKGGKILKTIAVTGTITPDKNKVWRVAARVSGTVLSLEKGVGDTVAQGDLLAIVESREVAEAKSEYVSALVNFGLQKTLFEREEELWRGKIQAEQQYLKAKTTYTESELKLHLSRQKLVALGIPDTEFKKLSMNTMNGIQKYEIRSPAKGKVIERLVDNGTPVGGEGQAKELYMIADLSQVWIELSLSPNDLQFVKEGQEVALQATPQQPNLTQKGKIIFISPVLNQESRAARVVAAFSNEDNALRPGLYVPANIAVENTEVDVLLPKTAIQNMEGSTVVFVRTKDGFEKRKVVIGKEDSTQVEIAVGVDPGEVVAIENTFLIKAELGKSEAEHSH